MMSSPVTIPMRTLPPSPSSRATSITASAQPRTFTPPALAVTLISALNTRGQDSPHQRNEILRVTGIRIARLLLLHDRHRDFREIVEHQIVDWSTFNLAHGRVRKISPKALSGCNANFLFHLEFGNDATKRHKKHKGLSSALLTRDFCAFCAACG